MLRIKQFGHLALRCGDPSRLGAFYIDVVGLGLTAADPAGHRYLHLDRDHHCLVLVPGESGLDHYAFEIEPSVGLERAARFLQGQGIDFETGPFPEAGIPAAIRLRDPDGNCLELYEQIEPLTVNRTQPLRPLSLHHLALSSPNLEAMSKFYVDLFGFKITDWMGTSAVWLRCDAEHHRIAMFRSDRPGLDHFAFDVAGWADFKQWGDWLARRGHPIEWGPGRHGPGNNLFVIFLDPEGNRIELSAEMEAFFDDAVEYQPRQWSPKAKSLNLWGPGPSWR